MYFKFKFDGRSILKNSINNFLYKFPIQFDFDFIFNFNFLQSGTFYAKTLNSKDCLLDEIIHWIYILWGL